MAITNLGQLRTAITSWMLDLSDVGANVDDCITLGHAYIFTKLRTRKMVTRVTLAATANEFTLPADYLQHRRVTQLTYPRRPLEYITPKAAEYLYATRPTGLGIHFTTEGDKLIVFPYVDSTIELSYYAEAPELVNEGDTNWLLLKYPQLYLAAGQMYAADFLKENEEVTKQATIVDTYIDLLNAQHMSEEYSSAEYTFLGDTP